MSHGLLPISWPPHSFTGLRSPWAFRIRHEDAPDALSRETPGRDCTVLLHALAGIVLVLASNLGHASDSDVQAATASALIRQFASDGRFLGVVERATDGPVSSGTASVSIPNAQAYATLRSSEFGSGEVETYANTSVPFMNAFAEAFVEWDYSEEITGAEGSQAYVEYRYRLDAEVSGYENEVWFSVDSEHGIGGGEAYALVQDEDKTLLSYFVHKALAPVNEPFRLRGFVQAYSLARGAESTAAEARASATALGRFVTLLPPGASLPDDYDSSDAANHLRWESGASGNFQTPSSWTPERAPASDDTVVFSSGTYTVDFDASHAVSTLAVDFLGRPTLKLDGTTLSAGKAFVGVEPLDDARLVISNGTLQLDFSAVVGADTEAVGELAVVSGGRVQVVNPSPTMIGFGGGTGRLRVSGAGASWEQAAGTLFLGNLSAGTSHGELVIEGGGNARFHSVELHTGVIDVTGAGSRMEIPLHAILGLGLQGSGSQSHMQVREQANAVLGSLLAVNAVVDVTTGARLSVSDDFLLGPFFQGGNGSRLTVSDGADINVGGNLLIAFEANPVGGAVTAPLVQVDNARLSVVHQFTLDASGEAPARLAIDFGEVLAESLKLGAGNGQSGRVDMQGGSAAVDELFVGDAGLGEFDARGGAVLVANRVHLGNESTSQGTATMRGSLLSLPAGDALLEIGTSGAGSLFLADGTTVDMPGATSRVVVGGGAGGGGILEIINPATVFAARLATLEMAQGDGSTASVEVRDGAIALFESIVMGKGGDTAATGPAARLSVTNGAVLAVDNTASDLASALAGELGVFVLGNSELVVADGALLATPTLLIDRYTNASGAAAGRMRVTAGPGAPPNTTVVTNNLVVGRISAPGDPAGSGGTLELDGDVALSTGRLAVAGAGRIRVDRAASLESGDASVGSLSGIPAGAPTVEVVHGAWNTDSLIIGGAPNLSAEVKVHAQGTLNAGLLAVNVNGILHSSGTLGQGDGVAAVAGGSVTLDGGEWRTSVASVVADSSGKSGDVEIRGGAWFSDTVFVGGGAASALPSMVNVHAGAKLAANELHVLANGLVKGHGELDVGLVTVDENGVLSPGTSPGTLRVTGDLRIAPGGTLEIEIGGRLAGSQHDQLIVDGNLDIQGLLVLAFIDGFAPVAGDEFDILRTAGVTTAQFGALEVRGLEAGWEFDFAASGSGLRLTSRVDGVALPAPVPLPPAVVMFASALLGLLKLSGVRR